jgi:hypothetical protein
MSFLPNYNNNEISQTTGDYNETKKKTFLNRTKKKQEEMQQIEKNIENSLKVNPNDLINPLETNIKNSLFFRLHVSGLIESANVNFFNLVLRRRCYLL